MTVELHCEHKLWRIARALAQHALAWRQRQGSVDDVIDMVSERLHSRGFTREAQLERPSCTHPAPCIPKSTRACRMVAICPESVSFPKSVGSTCVMGRTQRIAISECGRHGGGHVARRARRRWRMTRRRMGPMAVWHLAVWVGGCGMGEQLLLVEHTCPDANGHMQRRW